MASLDGGPRTDDFLDVLVQRRAHDERRADLYQRIRHVQDTQRKQLERATADAQDTLLRVTQRLHVTAARTQRGALAHHQPHRSRDTVDTTATATAAAAPAGAEQRLREMLQESRRTTAALLTAIDATLSECERLQQQVSARETRNGVVEAALKRLTAAGPPPSPAIGPSTPPPDDAAPPRALADLAQRTAAASATALSAVSAVTVDFIALQDDIERRLRSPSARRDDVLRAVSDAAHDFLASYTRLRSEQRTHYRLSLRTIAAAVGDIG
ncbi:hypothetical protein NESM_000896700 [Novymonas esmeraldas]|uniref:Uncharacterized protein n=1 Tax=Novymonas esmeraldas TaxID=1808958 RepID=A0AAW0F224_9TRYP